MNNGKILEDAIRAFTLNTIVETGHFEGDQTTWHIRFAKKVGDMEAWCLWNGNTLQSSPALKSTVQKWRDDELAKLV